MELIMASNEASKWIICRPGLANGEWHVNGDEHASTGIVYRLGIEAVFADLRHLSQLFIKISKYDTHRLALHYGNLMRECIQHQSISKFGLSGHQKSWMFTIREIDACSYFVLFSNGTTTTLGKVECVLLFKRI
ncbi:uncharacterized protein LOC141633708 isoform X3 [Silene latifolia]|uniref:uncharacterized protein LOC141633708 isoform X3 n=2 Tax=Silene latifolia TaxID=37657 RepID=UPI003D788DC5